MEKVRGLSGVDSRGEARVSERRADEGSWEKLGERRLSREATRRIGQRALGRTVNSVKLTEEDFADIYSPESIESDLRYVAERKRNFANPEIKDAQDFEKLFVRGVQLNRWLGNLPDQRGEVAFSTRTHETADLDDYSHRLDAFTVLRFREPVETDTGVKLRTLPLGFDVTISGHPETILDKMTRSYNDDAELPFGFSHLKYYTDGREKSSLSLLPRYVIGIDLEELDVLRSKTSGSETNLHSPAALRMRFKTLAEIRAQNELFQAMLPDDAYDSEDAKVQLAQAYIEVADEQLNRALADCADEMIKRRCLPNDVIKQVEESRNPFRARKVIEDYFLEESQERFREGWHGRADENMDPFVQIIACARELTAAAYDDSQPKRQAAIDERRRVLPQNQKLVLPPVSSLSSRGRVG